MGRTANSDLTIQASVEDKASSVFGDIGQEAGKLGSKMVELNQAAELVGKGFDLVKDVLSEALDVLIDCTKEAIEADKAERDLATALGLSGKASADALPHLKALADAIQKKTGIDGDQITQMQAQLALLGVLPENLEASTVAALGWSRATGKDMVAAGTDVAKVLEGNIPKGLKSLAPELKTTQEYIDFMARSFQLLEADGQTLEGSLNILSRNFEDLKRTLGGAVTSSDAAQSSVHVLNEAVLELTTLFESKDFAAAVNETFKGIAGGASAVINTLLGIHKMYEDGVTKAKVMMSDKGFLEAPLDVAEGKAKSYTEILGELADQLSNVAAGGPHASASAHVDVSTKVTQQADPEAEKRGKAAAEKARKAWDDAGRSISDNWERDQIRMAEAAAESQRHAAISALRYQQEIYETQGASSDARRKEREEKEIREEQEHLTKMNHNVEIFADSAANFLEQAFRSGFDNIGDLFLHMLEDLAIQLAKTELMNVLKGALGAGAVAASGGTAGPVGVVASAFGAILPTFASHGGPVPRFASGGMVDGPPGIDNVPAWLTRGEYVLPVETVDAIRNDRPPPKRGPQKFANGGAVAGNAGGGDGITIHYAPQTLIPQSSAELERHFRDHVLPVLSRLKTRGF